MDKFNGKDPYGLLRGKDQIYNGNERKFAFHSAWDKWDKVYGEGKKDYEVYVLCDEHQSGHYEYGPLTFQYKPIYVGSGKRGRSIESAAVGRQRDKGGEKVHVLEEMQQRNDKVRICIIGKFYTEKKAKVVEMKLLNLIPKSILSNGEFPFCEIPLKPEDYEYHYNEPKVLLV